MRKDEKMGKRGKGEKGEELVMPYICHSFGKQLPFWPFLHQLILLIIFCFSFSNFSFGPLVFVHTFIIYSLIQTYFYNTITSNTPYQAFFILGDMFFLKHTYRRRGQQRRGGVIIKISFIFMIIIQGRNYKTEINPFSSF